MDQDFDREENSEADEPESSDENGGNMSFFFLSSYVISTFVQNEVKLVGDGPWTRKDPKSYPPKYEVDAVGRTTRILRISHNVDFNNPTSSSRANKIREQQHPSC